MYLNFRKIGTIVVLLSLSHILLPAQGSLVLGRDTLLSKEYVESFIQNYENLLNFVVSENSSTESYQNDFYDHFFEILNTEITEIYDDLRFDNSIINKRSRDILLKYLHRLSLKYGENHSSIELSNIHIDNRILGSTFSEVIVSFGKKIRKTKKNDRDTELYVRTKRRATIVIRKIDNQWRLYEFSVCSKNDLSFPPLIHLSKDILNFDTITSVIEDTIKLSAWDISGDLLIDVPENCKIYDLTNTLGKFPITSIPTEEGSVLAVETLENTVKINSIKLKVVYYPLGNGVLEDQIHFSHIRNNIKQRIKTITLRATRPSPQIALIRGEISSDLSEKVSLASNTDTKAIKEDSLLDIKKKIYPGDTESIIPIHLNAKYLWDSLWVQARGESLFLRKSGNTSWETKLLFPLEDSGKINTTFELLYSPVEKETGEHSLLVSTVNRRFVYNPNIFEQIPGAMAALTIPGLDSMADDPEFNNALITETNIYENTVENIIRLEPVNLPHPKFIRLGIGISNQTGYPSLPRMPRKYSYPALSLSFFHPIGFFIRPFSHIRSAYRKDILIPENGERNSLEKFNDETIPKPDGFALHGDPKRRLRSFQAGVYLNPLILARTFSRDYMRKDVFQFYVLGGISYIKVTYFQDYIGDFDPNQGFRPYRTEIIQGEETDIYAFDFSQQYALSPIVGGAFVLPIRGILGVHAETAYNFSYNGMFFNFGLNFLNPITR